jgi:hypothetical protein
MTSNERNNHWMSSSISALEKIHPAFLIFLVLVLNFLTFVPHTNEEQYLLYAQQNYNPDWIPGSVMATEFPGTRFLFELLFGWMADWWGFEVTVFIGRFLNFLCLAFPLAAIFKLINLRNFQIFLVLQIFLVADQSLFGNEWIFEATEAKTWAYVFVFWSLFNFLRKEYFWAIGLMVVATYFHILVGGWFAISCFLTLLICQFPFKKLFQLGLLYGIPLLPFLYYLGRNMLAEEVNFGSEVNLDHIYVYFRNKHHIGLFYTYEYFFEKHFLGLFVAIILFIAYLKSDKLISFFNRNSEYWTLRNLMMVMFGIGFVFVVISWVDKVFFELSGGFLLKSYPFRMQALAFLILLMLSIKFLSDHPDTSKKWNRILPVVILLSGLLMLVKFGLNIKKMSLHRSNEAYNEVISFLNEKTPKPATVMVLNNNQNVTSGRQNDAFAIDLMRRTRHDNFVHFKYIPSTPNKMYEWYQRIQFVQEVEGNPKRLETLSNTESQYKIDYVLALKDFDYEGNILFENEQYKVYEMR